MTIIDRVRARVAYDKVLTEQMLCKQYWFPGDRVQKLVDLRPLYTPVFVPYKTPCYALIKYDPVIDEEVRKHIEQGQKDREALEFVLSAMKELE